MDVKLSAMLLFGLLIVFVAVPFLINEYVEDPQARDSLSFIMNPREILEKPLVGMLIACFFVGGLVCVFFPNSRR